VRSTGRLRSLPCCHRPMSRSRPLTIHTHEPKNSSVSTISSTSATADHPPLPQRPRHAVRHGLVCPPPEQNRGAARRSAPLPIPFTYIQLSVTRHGTGSSSNSSAPDAIAYPNTRRVTKQLTNSTPPLRFREFDDGGCHQGGISFLSAKSWIGAGRGISSLPNWPAVRVVA